MQFSRNQWFVIASAVILTVSIFIFGDINQKKIIDPKDKAMRPATQKSTSDFDFENYLQKVNKLIGADTLKKIEDWEKNKDWKSLIQVYHQRGESVAEAYFTQKQATFSSNPKDFERAADLFSNTAVLSQEEKMHGYLADQAVTAYQAAYSLDSNNTAIKLKLGTAFMDQGTNPMQGVSLLLDLVKKDSTNAEAQFMLGKFGMVSNQFEKALQRFEKVIYLQPQNTDALFLAGIANKELGNKTKAIAYLEKCVGLVKNKSLKGEINSYIQDLKKK